MRPGWGGEARSCCLPLGCACPVASRAGARAQHGTEWHSACQRSSCHQGAQLSPGPHSAAKPTQRRHKAAARGAQAWQEPPRVQSTLACTAAATLLCPCCLPGRQSELRQETHTDIGTACGATTHRVQRGSSQARKCAHAHLRIEAQERAEPHKRVLLLNVIPHAPQRGAPAAAAAARATGPLLLTNNSSPDKL
jgi:hypothetical protein